MACSWSNKAFYVNVVYGFIHDTRGTCQMFTSDLKIKVITFLSLSADL